MAAIPRMVLLVMIATEIISSNTANTQEAGNAWSAGGGIDWTHVGRGGQASGTRGTSNNNRVTSTSNNNRVTSTSSNNRGTNNNNRGTSNTGTASRPQSVTSSELRRLAEELYTLDTNSVGDLVTINPQGRTVSSNPTDNAPSPLFNPVPAGVLQGPTIGPLYQLLDNYQPSVTARDTSTPQEKAEEEAFLNAVVATPLMARLGTFLSGKGLITAPLKDVLKEIWFTSYPRSRRTLGSSGFEHVFVGETKNGKVSGFHNWVSFVKEEQEGDLDYFGHMKTINLTKAQLIMLKFKWSDGTKPIGSMFVGTSPELEMALYTVCFFTRQGNLCPMSLGGHRFNIKTYSQSYEGKTLIGTAFPIV